MFIENAIYCHAHRKNWHTDLWKPGNIISFGNEDNHFFWGLKHSVNLPVIKKLPRSFYDSNRDYLNDISRLTDKENPQNVNNQDLMYALESAIDRLSEYNEDIFSHRKLLLETIFETVRLKSYAELPSRQKCIWVCDEADLPTWSTLFQESKLLLYRVSLTGKMHRGDGSFISADLFKFEQFEELAVKYWNGEQNENPMERMPEYLFEGTITVLDVL